MLNRMGGKMILVRGWCTAEDTFWPSIRKLHRSLRHARKYGFMLYHMPFPSIACIDSHWRFTRHTPMRVNAVGGIG